MGQPAPLGVAASGLPPLLERNGVGANAVDSGVISGVGPGKPFAVWGPMNIVVWAQYLSALTTTKGSSTAGISSAGVVAKGDAINSVNVPRGTTVGAITGTNITLSFPTITLYGTLNTTNGQVTGLPQTLGLVGATATCPSLLAIIPANTTVSSIITPATPRQTNGVVLLSNIPTSVPNIVGTVPIEFALTNDAVVSGTDLAATYTGFEIAGAAATTFNIERSFDGGATWIICNIGGSGQPAQFAFTTPVSVSFGEPERNVLYRINVVAFGSQSAATTINYRISATGMAAVSLSVGSTI